MPHPSISVPDADLTYIHVQVGVLVAIMKHRPAVPKYDVIGCEPQQSYGGVLFVHTN